MTLDIVDNDSVQTVCVNGRLTTETAPELEACLNDVCAGASRVEVDLAKCDYVSSAGLRVFMMTYKDAAQGGYAFMLMHPNEVVLETLEMVGMLDLFDVVQ